MSAKYERILVDSFSTWHGGGSLDIDQKTGNICVINEGGLFIFLHDKGNYTKQAKIADLNTWQGGACVSIDDNTGTIAAVHEQGLDLYQPYGDSYTKISLDTFSARRKAARCVFNKNTGNVVLVNDAEGLSLFRKKDGGYEKMVIDRFGTWHSDFGIALNQSNGDIFVALNHKGGGEGPYPVKSDFANRDSLPKGDCVARYRPIGNDQYMKMIVARPIKWESGSDIDVNDETGELFVISDPGIYSYKPSGDGYAKTTLDSVHTLAEGTALRVNRSTGELVVVTDGLINISPPGHKGVPVDLAMTRNSGVDVDINGKTGDIAVVDNRGLTIYRRQS